MISQFKDDPSINTEPSVEIFFQKLYLLGTHRLTTLKEKSGAKARGSMGQRVGFSLVFFGRVFPFCLLRGTSRPILVLVEFVSSWTVESRFGVQRVKLRWLRCCFP